MATALDLARGPATVNTLLKPIARAAQALCGQAAAGAGPRELEEGVWRVVQALGRGLLETCIATACRARAEADVEARGLEPRDARFRLDQDYHATQMSTFGPIRFPLFAWRERRGAATITRTPAREALVPLHGRCRSTPVCLEWEARLGKDLPFRRAADALCFFSHGAVREEDTTLAAHTIAVGAAIQRHWLYRPVDDIRRLLQDRATRDRTTGRPILYLSQDAHSERRFVDDTWNAAWKSMNGLRIWAIDRATGETIHLGGEYTWGDCNVVADTINDLIELGILARDGDYGGGLRAELVVVTDGLPWIENHVLAKLPWAHPVLDLYHALQHLGDFAAAHSGAGTQAASRLYRRFAKQLVPERRRRPKPATPRKGHQKSRRLYPKRERPVGSIWALLQSLHAAQDELTVDGPSEPLNALIGYLENNLYRGDYDVCRQRGFQLGSGAMESLHRTAAQARLKLAGARWTARASLASVNLRLLELAGRWDEFWAHDGIERVLDQAFRLETA
ncbi:MAG: hypothetical protein R3F60_21510 [bacterium]